MNFPLCLQQRLVLIGNSGAKFFRMQEILLPKFQGRLSRLASFNLQRNLDLIYVYNESWHRAEQINGQIPSIFPNHL